MCWGWYGSMNLVDPFYSIIITLWNQELLSDLITWGEYYLNVWKSGVYVCSKCLNPLYSSKDKYHGPCVWPSFRQPFSEHALSLTTVYPYNKYIVQVDEVYCGRCSLFIGHRFEDAREKGDTHINAHWRHWVLSLSLRFVPDSSDILHDSSRSRL